MKLVAYFTTSGVTAKKAEEIAKREGADLFVIRPEVPYTGADLDWQDRDSRSNVEMADKKCRVPMAKTCEDIDKYDEIYLGFPLWWGTAPRIINTFLESADFTGKTIKPFCTSGGSEYGKTNDDLIPSAPGAIFEEGQRIR